MGTKTSLKTVGKKESTSLFGDENGRKEGRRGHDPRDKAEPAASTSTRGGQNLLYRRFPLDCLPEPVHSFVGAGAKAIGCDPANLALPLLSALGSAIGNTRALKLKNSWKVPPIIWTLVIGESGSSKTPAQSLVLRAVYRRQSKAQRDFSAAMQKFKRDEEAYRARKKEWKDEVGKAQPPMEPRRPLLERCVVSDTTVEAIAPILKENPRGLLLARDELSGWFGSFNKYSSGKGADEGHWLSMYNGQQLVVDRKTGNERTIFVPSSAVGITGGIQPGVMKSALGSERREAGMLARFLVAYPPQRKKVWSEADIPQAIENAVVQIFDRLYDLQGKGTPEEPSPVLIELTREAKRLWMAHYDANGEEQLYHSGDMCAALAKLEEYAARLALVIHLVRWAANDPQLDDGGRLDGRSMEAGILLCNWFKQEAERVYPIFTESAPDGNDRKLIQFIHKKDGRVLARDVQRGCGWLSKKGEAESALQKLVGRGFGDWEVSSPSRGASTQCFVLFRDNGSVTTLENDAETSGFVELGCSMQQATGSSNEESIAV